MDPLAPVISALHGSGPLRVWSLVITVFGDAVNPRGGRIAALRLQLLLERLRIEPGTLRTALSRLAADGWIEREKDGRHAFYSLSEKGRVEFAPATRRIYRAPEEPETWTLGAGVPPPGAFSAPPLWLAPGASTAAGLAVTGTLSPVAEDRRAAFLPPDRVQDLAALGADIGTIGAADLDPLAAIAARTVLIHRWRRIVLANADLPDAIRPADLPGRSDVARLYRRLLPRSEAWLDDGGLPPLPPEDGSIYARFRD